MLISGQAQARMVLSGPNNMGLCLDMTREVDREMGISMTEP